MPERSSNGSSKQPHASREQLQRRIDELSAQLVETERALSAAKRERDEHKISAAGASVSELEAQKSKAELIKDKEALRDALQVCYNTNSIITYCCPAAFPTGRPCRTQAKGLSQTALDLG